MSYLIFAELLETPFQHFNEIRLCGRNIRWWNFCLTFFFQPNGATTESKHLSRFRASDRRKREVVRSQPSTSNPSISRKKKKKRNVKEPPHHSSRASLSSLNPDLSPFYMCTQTSPCITFLRLCFSRCHQQKKKEKN